MNFELDAEQAMLRDSVRQWVAKNYAFNQRKEIGKLADGFNRDHWREMAELGWLGVSMPEELGGLGGSPIETALIAEELGRGLVLEPYVSVAILAAHVLERAALASQREALIPSLISGEKIIALAHGEHEARDELQHVEARAAYANGSWRLAGAKSLVVAASAADVFLISARTSGKHDDRDGISLFAVDASTKGLRLRTFQTIDGARAADLAFEISVPSDALIGARDQAIEALEYGHQQAITAACAEAIGMMDQALWMTRDYLLTRKQFGVLIGTFQALQHRAADMYVEVQVARAALWRALASFLETDVASRRRAIQSAKAQVGKTARFVCGQAVQLHGGIAITEEFAIGHYFKRMCMFDLMYGNTHLQLQKIARELARTGEESKRSNISLAS
jgi:alkylation response protein AidB-like acyl-CoA dehydrogenase